MKCSSNACAVCAHVHMYMCMCMCMHVHVGHRRVFEAADRAEGGGERQRVALASLTRSRTPRVVLLDEPARGLHSADLRGVLEVLHELAARDLVLAVSHRAEVMDAADQVIRLT